MESDVASPSMTVSNDAHSDTSDDEMQDQGHSDIEVIAEEPATNGSSHSVKKRTRRVHSKNLVYSVVQMIKKKEITIRQASDEFGIPRTTLCNKVNGRRPNDKPGRTTFLTSSEEEQVARWCLEMQEAGKSVTKNQLVDQVKFILDSNGRHSPFRENRPGRKWYRLFMKRNPHLHLGCRKTLIRKQAVCGSPAFNEASETKAFPVSPSSQVETTASPRECPYDLSNLPKLLRSYKAYDISSDVGRIYTIEEICFQLDNSSGAILDCRHSARPSLARQQITVFACYSAAGHFCSPILTFPDSWFSYDPLDGFPEAYLGTSGNGYLNGDLFYCWLKERFIPEVDAQSVAKPVLILLSKCSHLLNDAVLELCEESSIILHCETQLSQSSDPRTTHPFLVNIIKPVWRTEVAKYLKDNCEENVTKEVFARLLKPAWQQAATAGVAFTSVLRMFSNLLNGFLS